MLLSLTNSRLQAMSASRFTLWWPLQRRGQQSLTGEKLKQHGVHPSFSLPSSYHAVRAHVPPASIREVCDKHPRHEFNHLCDREAVVIPLLLARPEGTNLDTQVYRAHVQNSRRYLGDQWHFHLWLWEVEGCDRSHWQNASWGDLVPRITCRQEWQRTQNGD